MTATEGEARRTVRKYMWLSMGASVVPLPVVNVLGVSALQLRMLQVLAEHYGVPFSKDLGKEIISSLLGSIVPTSFSVTTASALKMVPEAAVVVSTLSMPIFAGAATYAIGKIFIQHFESGSTFLEFEPAKVREHFRQEFERGEHLAATSHGAAAYQA
jgi:uncharacterized protein (DUF697 family)